MTSNTSNNYDSCWDEPKQKGVFRLCMRNKSYATTLLFLWSYNIHRYIHWLYCILTKVFSPYAQLLPNCQNLYVCIVYAAQKRKRKKTEIFFIVSFRLQWILELQNPLQSYLRLRQANMSIEKKTWNLNKNFWWKKFSTKFVF